VEHTICCCIQPRTGSPNILVGWCNELMSRVAGRRDEISTDSLASHTAFCSIIWATGLLVIFLNTESVCHLQFICYRYRKFMVRIERTVRRTSWLIATALHESSSSQLEPQKIDTSGIRINQIPVVVGEYEHF
jgi:hypothetical protein